MSRKSGPKPLPRLAFSCPTCGTVVYILPSQLKQKKHVYCSRPCRDIGHQRHGETHKGTISPEYKTWRYIKNRCFNPNDATYKDYGARGITMCEKWRHDFHAFLADVGRKPSPEYTLDRYPNQDGNYEPGNVRWATRKEQAHNTRRNVLFTYNGKTQTMTTWLEESFVKTLGLTRAILSNRRKRGWSDEEALTSPREWRYPRQSSGA